MVFVSLVPNPSALPSARTFSPPSPTLAALGHRSSSPAPSCASTIRPAHPHQAPELFTPPPTPLLSQNSHNGLPTSPLAPADSQFALVLDASQPECRFDVLKDNLRPCTCGDVVFARFYSLHQSLRNGCRPLTWKDFLRLPTQTRPPQPTIPLPPIPSTKKIARRRWVMTDRKNHSY